MSLLLQTLRTVLLNVVADFFYFPIWWYAGGLKKQLTGILGSFLARQDALALDIWIKNIATPMYGQYDIQGRIISFIMRLAQIIGRLFILIVWGVLLVAWLIVWVLIPVSVAYFVFIQIRLMV
ncbi:MAG: hypothetical protein UX17_C0010G0004 [Parcubacteria group bacterium GW2011_GWC2_45_7]|nr:MAG: hypothetical protein UX17_C0010G0004 [Parcubacteria group bacterium GW2011_GWC2_45_7]KKU73816.1 MAG: hypothetical protein UX98_C0004G0015 [Parcubacteria group bacterium GW2011_GWA2_47_26]